MKGLKILVIRLDILNNLVDSRPCCMCVNFMRMFGIKKVYYSNKDGLIVSENISRMTDDTIHFSYGVRFEIFSDNPEASKKTIRRLPLTKNQYKLLREMKENKSKDNQNIESTIACKRR